MKKDIIATIAGVSAVAFAATVAACLRRYAGIDSAALVITVLLTGLLVWALSSGRLRDLRGPGGWRLRLGSISRTSIDLLMSPVQEGTTLPEQFSATDPDSALHAQSSLPTDRPIVLTCVMGGSHQSFASISSSLARLVKFPAFRFLVLQRASGTIIGYVRSEWLRELVLSGGLGVSAITMRLVNFDESKPAPFVGFMNTWLRPSDTLERALDIMDALNVSDLLVCDGDGRRIIGVAERGRLLTRVIKEMIRPRRQNERTGEKAANAQQRN